MIGFERRPTPQEKNIDDITKNVEECITRLDNMNIFLSEALPTIYNTLKGLEEKLEGKKNVRKKK